MSLKFLVPSFRNRYCYVKQTLKRYYNENGKAKKALHLGSGEGDYDPLISKYCENLVSCDINEDDLNYARERNKDLTNVQYEKQDGLNLDYNNEEYDLVVCIEVLEHIGKPARLMDEISRVLKDNGYLIMTYPSTQFPFTYDPINYILQRLNKNVLPIGAYAYGHKYLIDNNDFYKWCKLNNLQILNRTPIAKALICLFEIYWMGFLQKIVKSNSGNTIATSNKLSIRPKNKKPFFVPIVDFLISMDKLIPSNKSQSRGYYIHKKN